MRMTANRDRESTDEKGVNIHRHRPTPRRAGFSLLEMLAVVTILATLGMLVTPHLTDSHTTKLRSAAELLVADLEYAQAESIAHGDDLRVVVVNSTTTYTLATAAAPSIPIIEPVTKRNCVVTFGSGRANMLSGVTISNYSLGGDTKLGFGMYGQLDQAANATITLSCGGSTCIVTYNATTGQATIGSIN